MKQTFSLRRTKPAYYNEHDKYAAQWLRNLIAAGHIAAGDVDERSIEDVRPDDLRGYTQCHFFAGVGVWSYSLRRAGWSDDRPVWTGSCPCQPFSAAGQGAGFADERHLWPAFFHLIKECRPSAVLGEQVASTDADPWIDLVQDDMEALGYAFGAVPFPSAGVGAPHIRDRLYWVADANSTGCSARSKGRPAVGHLAPAESDRCVIGLGHTSGEGLAQRERITGVSGGALGANEGQAAVGTGLCIGGLADADGRNTGTEREQRGGEQRQQPQDGGGVPDGSAGPVNGYWRDADWLFCRDGKWRPVEPGTFPLVDGAPARVGRLRAYGNAINAEQACVFIEAVMA